MVAPTPTLINGTTDTISVTIGTNSLYDCVLGAWRATAVKQYFSQITFCSGGWRSNVGGIKAIDVICSGYLNHGNAISDPLVNFGQVNGGVACIFQASVNCTLTGNFYVDPGFGVIAGGPSELVYNLQSVGACATSWNTST